MYTLLTVRDPAVRAQLRWVAWGTLITCAGAITGGVLAGLLRRTRKDIEVISVTDVESVRKCIELV